MPVPCQTPCSMCGDENCICKFSDVHLLKDCDTKVSISDLRTVVSTDDKDLPSWSDPENPIC